MARSQAIPAFVATIDVCPRCGGKHISATFTMFDQILTERGLVGGSTVPPAAGSVPVFNGFATCPETQAPVLCAVAVSLETGAACDIRAYRRVKKMDGQSDDDDGPQPRLRLDEV